MKNEKPESLETVYTSNLNKIKKLIEIKWKKDSCYNPVLNTG